MKSLNCLRALCFAALSSALPAQALVIDYGYVSTHSYESLGQGVYDAIGRQTWYFTHASVGNNIIGGLNALHLQNSGTYQLQVRADDGTAPASVTPGSIYEYARGNPGWLSKYDIFKTTVEGSWGNKVDFVMDKLCYIDHAADALRYIEMMEYLQGRNLQADLVFTTMPLTTAADSENVSRNRYNETVRQYALAQNVLLFDIADLEAHSASGGEQTFFLDGVTSQMLYSGWSSDGGHLNDSGSRWIAQGWYALAASQVSGTDPVPEPATLILMGVGFGALLRRRLRSSPASSR